VSDDDEVTSNRAVRQMDERIRELERQLGRKTLEVEILKEALDKARPKNRRGLRGRRSRTVADEDCRGGARGLALQPP
jgi:predicted RNase H-like nuclease (RuvC/YqgF family)